MEDYSTSHYILGKTSPDSEPQKSLSDIVHAVHERLGAALDNDKVGLSDVHPQTIISMVVTNILVNLLFHSIVATDFKVRAEMVQDCLDEIGEMSMKLWTAMEASKADTTIAH